MSITTKNMPAKMLQCISRDGRAPMGKWGVTTPEAVAKHELKSEKALQALLMNTLRLREIWFTRSRMDRKTGNTIGTPDFIFAYHGKFCAWEVKTETGKLTEEQSAAHEKIREQGGVVVVIRSVREAIDFLEENKS